MQYSLFYISEGERACVFGFVYSRNEPGPIQKKESANKEVLTRKRSKEESSEGRRTENTWRTRVGLSRS